MKFLTCIFALLWLLGTGVAFAQSSCGFFDPKVTFADGTKACLSEFSFFSRQGLLTSFRNHLDMIRANPSYAIATPAKPASCPFVRFTAWDQAGQEGANALPRCQQRLDEASSKSTDFVGCRCEVLIESGTTKLSRSEFTQRLAAFDHYLQFGMTQDQTRKAEAEKAEAERVAKVKREAEVQARNEDARRQEEQRRIENAKREEDARRQQQTPSKPTTAPVGTVVANRKALVIGNDAYRHVEPLKTAREDARAIADNLKKVGFTVTLRTDLAEREMKAAIRNFAEKIDGGDEVAFFFAGHGVEIGSTNYLIPVDITGESPKQIRDEAIDLKRILDDVQERRAKLTLAIVDACRDNPFKNKWGTRTLGADSRGLAPTTPATGQMIIYSAGVGQKALDTLGDRDTNKNGVFTRVFIQQMQRPSISIDKIARDTRSEVVRLASTIGHEQVPAIYDQVIGEFFFIR